MVVNKLNTFLSKKNLIIAGSIVLFVVAAAVVSNQLQNNVSQTSDGSTATTEKPPFNTITPQSNAQNITWTRISPPENDPVYAYSDQIDDVAISVSQQPLPESFASNKDTQVSETAEKFNATEEIQAGLTKVYIGTSAQGPQSLIFTKNELLVLIKSQQKIDDARWISYINNLK
jgi:hypothetical protein